MVDAERIQTRQLILKWHERARIDYSDLYVKQYIAYNAWFRKVTDRTADHEAIREVVRRFVIWDDYVQGRTLGALSSVAQQIADLTSSRPLRTVGVAWNGVVSGSNDWKGLIYFWYQTRCDLFHGMTEPGFYHHDQQIQLAYESLHIFMNEIVKRMRHCFTDTDYARLTEVKRILGSESGVTGELKEIESRLLQKFIHSPDIWNVDMVRV